MTLNCNYQIILSFMNCKMDHLLYCSHQVARKLIDSSPKAEEFIREVYLVDLMGLMRVLSQEPPLRVCSYKTVCSTLCKVFSFPYSSPAPPCLSDPALLSHINTLLLSQI